MRRTARIYARFSPEEKAIVEQKAKAAGFTSSKFMRELGLHGRVQPVLSINLQQWSRLGGLGSNLNQLVRHCNQGVVPPDLKTVLEEIRDQVNAVRRDLITKREDPK